MEHTRKFRGDLSAICADLRSIQIVSGHKVVRLSPRKPEPTKASSRRVKPRAWCLALVVYHVDGRESRPWSLQRSQWCSVASHWSCPFSRSGWTVSHRSPFASPTTPPHWRSIRSHQTCPARRGRQDLVYPKFQYRALLPEYGQMSWSGPRERGTSLNNQISTRWNKIIWQFKDIPQDFIHIVDF